MFYVFPKNKICFYHLHRTAGGTLSRVLKHLLKDKRFIIAQDKRCHETFKWCHQQYDTSALQLVTSLRNPYDQVISLYHWIRKGIKNSFIKSIQRKYRPEQLKVHTMNFEDFTDWYCDHWKSYDEWLQLDGNIPDYFFIKKESMQEGISEFLDLSVQPDWYQWKWWHSNGKINRSRDDYYTKQCMYDRITDKQRWCFDQKFYQPAVI